MIPMKLAPTLLGITILAAIGVGANALVAARTRAALGDPGILVTQSRPLPVETIELLPQDSIRIPRRFTGTVEPRRRSDLAFEGSGRIATVRVDEGDRVAEGAVLAQLDTEQLRAQRNEVSSRRVGLQAQLDELVAGPRKEVIDAAKADVRAFDEESQFARLQLERRKDLVDRGSISSEQFDTTRAQVRTVEARLSGARARLAELENGTRAERLAAQRGALGEVDAALASIDVQIERATLRAPFGGTISARLLDEGSVVSLMMPQAVFTLIETGALEARIGIPGDLLDGSLAGALNGAALDLSQVELVVRGHVVAVERQRTMPDVDAGTRTIPVVFEFAVESARRAGVRPGDIVNLTLMTRRNERGAWLPLSALSESTRGLWSAYAVVPGDGGDRVERLELEVMHVQAGRAYVRGTFVGSARVVSSGAHRLVPGQAVLVTNAPSAARTSHD